MKMMNSFAARFGVFLILVGFASEASAQVGFICSKQNVEISKMPAAPVADSAAPLEQLVIKSLSDPKAIESYGQLPVGMGVDAYQERVGTYYTLIETAQLSFPYAPEFVMIARIAQSDRRQGQARYFE
jgi:hypothetical protein